MFSLEELNQNIRVKLAEFNSRSFQKREGSRESVFLTEEKDYLIPLPDKPFQISEWKTAKVQFHYHIAVDKMKYSVPYEYIKHTVDVRMTAGTIEIFYRALRIASHPRLTGKPNQYSTLHEHMPPNHQHQAEWDAARFINWAKRIGPSTEKVIRPILDSSQIEQQSYKSCMGILRLGDKHGVLRLEKAAEKSLTYTGRPSYKNINMILKNGQDTLPTDTYAPRSQKNSDEFVISRGSAYYGGDESC
ncbi:MAG: hypothetical protein FWF59_12720 [Turicibacter sp.]|nr:hypothetical protein [Turicibacter sp.]